MPNNMLINATQPEELRVALIDEQGQLFDLDIENPGREQKKGNIYKARIVRYEPSLEALFVYYGSDRHGFLPIREIAREYFASSGIEELNRSNIKEVLPEGRELLIQIDKEERGTKGAALTTFISLAGCYLVLMPNNPRAGGVSRRVEGDERAELRENLSTLAVPEDMGLIIRTAGVGRHVDDLQWDLSVLLSQWKAIQEAAKMRSAPALIHQEGNVVIRSIRDYLRPDIDQVIIDQPKIFEEVQAYIKMVRPDFLDRIKLYEDSVPLFNRYQIENQIESAFKRQVQLRSGGALVIDHTEALVSIDINSARATKGGDIEETALLTNLEAADEIARQCRLRDLGGLIVIDFIDMMAQRNQRAVETRLREAVEKDRARIQIGRISRFGLMEMSRQRLRPVLGEASRVPCPTCEGQGNIRSADAQALIVLRVIEEEAIKDHTAAIHAELPLNVATYLMNEKRNVIIALENRHNIKILVIPNAALPTPHYHVKRVRDDEASSRHHDQPSYSMATKTEPRTETLLNKPPVAAAPAVKQSLLTTLPMTSVAPQKTEAPNLIKRLWGSLFRANEEDQGTEETKRETTADTHRPRQQHRPGPTGGSPGWPRQQRPLGPGQQRRAGSQQSRGPRDMQDRNIREGRDNRDMQDRNIREGRDNRDMREGHEGQGHHRPAHSQGGFQPGRGRDLRDKRDGFEGQPRAPQSFEQEGDARPAGNRRRSQHPQSRHVGHHRRFQNQPPNVEDAQAHQQNNRFPGDEASNQDHHQEHHVAEHQQQPSYNRHRPERHPEHRQQGHRRERLESTEQPSTSVEQHHEPRHEQARHESRHEQAREPHHEQAHEPRHEQAHEPRHEQAHEPRHEQAHEPRHEQAHEPRHEQAHEPRHEQAHEPRHEQAHEPRHEQAHEPRHEQDRQEQHHDEKPELQNVVQSTPHGRPPQTSRGHSGHPYKHRDRGHHRPHREHQDYRHNSESPSKPDESPVIVIQTNIDED